MTSCLDHPAVQYMPADSVMSLIPGAFVVVTGAFAASGAFVSVGIITTLATLTSFVASRIISELIWKTGNDLNPLVFVGIHIPLSIAFATLFAALGASLSILASAFASWAATLMAFTVVLVAIAFFGSCL